MKMPGVSLIAAAIPTAIRRAGRARRVWYIGSSIRPAATMAATTVPDGRQPASLRVSRLAQVSAPMEASSHTTRTTAAGIAASGVKSAAANGG